MLQESPFSPNWPDFRSVWPQFHVQHAWLFGSRSRSASTASGDWDILVEFSQPPSFSDFMGLKETLEKKVGAPVDLLSKNACSPRFLAAIEKDLVNVT